MSNIVSSLEPLCSKEYKDEYVLNTVVTPGLLQKKSKECNNPGEFLGLVVFLAVLFRKFDKKLQNVTVRA